MTMYLFKAYIGLNAVSGYHSAITIYCHVLEHTIQRQLSLAFSKKHMPLPRLRTYIRSRPLGYGPLLVKYEIFLNRRVFCTDRDLNSDCQILKQVSNQYATVLSLEAFVTKFVIIFLILSLNKLFTKNKLYTEGFFLGTF